MEIAAGPGGCSHRRGTYSVEVEGFPTRETPEKKLLIQTVLTVGEGGK